MRSLLEAMVLEEPHNTATFVARDSGEIRDDLVSINLNKIDVIRPIIAAPVTGFRI